MATWDYTTCEDYVKIETVEGDEVIDLVAEIPIGFDQDAAERAAEAICNAHNRGELAKPKPLKMGRVFYSEGIWKRAIQSIVPGWYYQIDMAEPVGPFDTQLDAGRAARATIVAD